MYITTICPVRISLVGGSSDLDAYLDTHGKGSVISFTPNLHTYISLYKDEIGMNSLDGKYIINYSKREEVLDANEIQNDLIKVFFQECNVLPCSVHMTSDIFSHGSGLAASSSYSCCLSRAITEMKGDYLPNIEYAAMAYNMEKKINPLLGMQDPFGCCVGGFKKIEFKKNEMPKYKQLPTDLFNHYDVCIYFTGCTRNSTKILKSIVVPETDVFNPLVDKAEKYILSRDFDSLMSVIRDGWEQKKKTTKAIFDDINLKILDDWIESISIAHKLCGAGNGGFFLAFFKKDSIIPKGFIKTSVSNLGLRTIANLSKNKIKGVVAGAFDVIHPGYCRLFKECKQYCNHLTVALHEDPSSGGSQKLKPAHTLEERTEILSAISYIDEITPYRCEDELELLLKQGNFHKRFLGSDYINKIKFTGKHLNIPIIFIERDHEYSSTRLKKMIADSYIV